MKRFLSAACAVMLAALPIASMPMTGAAQNPLAQNVYTSDPAPMVDGDTVYVYTGHDKDGADYYYMPDWKCYSTKDMQNYTDHGTVLSWDDFEWAEEDTAWAAQCVKRGDKYYMYVTLVPKGGGRAIGVAVADKPEGPFKDALGKPLCGPDWSFIDPTVFIDDGGQAYLYFGNPQLHYVKLNEDMISYSGEIQKIEMTTEGFGVKEDGTTYTEGPWFYKRGDLYYMLYAANGVPEDIRYSTSPNPTGPWTYRGVIMPKQGGSFTNHCGVVDFKGHSYFYYHNGALPGGNGFQRSVCAEEFTYNPDGTFPEINMTKEGPAQIEAVDPYIRQEAEMMSWSEGIETEKIDAGGLAIGFIENGDYVKVSGVDFADGAESFTASVSSNGAGGSIEIHLDAKDGPLAGTAKVPVTGGWQEWQEVTCDVKDAKGEHDVYFVFTGGESYLFNVDWWQFGGAGSNVPVTPGDVNSDGVIDIFDLSLAKRGVVDGFADANAAKAADVDKSGRADVKDLIQMTKYLHGLIKGFGEMYVITPTDPIVPSEEPVVEPTPKEAMSMADFTALCESKLAMNEPDSARAENPGTAYGEIKSGSYYSTTCKREKPYNILLPAGYDESKKYPVLYVMHGYWENQDRMIIMGNNPMHTREIIGNAIAAGEAKDMIVVFPYIYSSDTQDGCSGMDDFNNAAYDNFINDLTKDLMPHIESTYSVKTGKDNTAITGFSMGGRESLLIGMQRSDLFGYVGAICPAPGVTGAFQWDAGKEPYLVYITAGGNDTVVYDTPKPYHESFEKNGVPHIWHYYPAGYHGDNSINAHLYNFCRFVFQATN